MIRTSRNIPVLTGTKELRLGGAKFNCEAAVFSKLLITSLSPALVNTVEATAVGAVWTGVIDNPGFSRLLFLASKRISSTFCSPIWLLSDPGLNVGNEGLDFVIRYEVLPVNALRNKELPEKEENNIFIDKSWAKAEQNESVFLMQTVQFIS